MKNNILILVDMQKDFVSGALGSKMAMSILPAVAKKIEYYNNSHSLIIATLDTHDKNYLGTLEGKYLPIEHCIKGTNGHKIEESLAKLLDSNTVYVEKKSFGSLKLIDAIKEYVKTHKIDETEMCIELVGLCTDICVVSNAILLRAAFANTKITVDASCCAGTTKEKHLATLEVLKSCQIDVL